MRAPRSAGLVLWALGLVGSGCAERALDLGAAFGPVDGTGGGRTDGSTDGHMSTGPHPPGGLPQAYCERIVVLGEHSQLALFDPVALSFEDLPALSCPAQPGQGAYSIALDGEGALWVAYSNGELFTADLRSGACTSSSIDVPRGDKHPIDLAVTRAPATGGGDPVESLFTSAQANDGGWTLGRVNLSTKRYEALGGLPGGVELTTSDAGELWGLYRIPAPRIARFDTGTGAVLADVNVALGNIQGNGVALSWWKGALYAFVWPSGSSSSVYHIDPATGAVDRILRRSGRNLISATIAHCFD